MSTSARILLIGLDAADSDLISRWAASGHLPNFRRLLQQGARAVCHPPAGLYVGAVWPSFATSVSPTSHRRYCYSQFRPGSYENDTFDVGQIQGDPFWLELSQQGKRVCVLDVPKTRLTQPDDGIHVVDWLTHDAELPDTASWPEPLAREIQSRFMPKAPRCDAQRSSAAEQQALAQQLVQRIRSKGELSRELLLQGNWDLFLTVFNESHCAGHQLWHVHDTDHPRHDVKQASETGNLLRDVYMALDQEAGRLLDAAGPECRVMLLASHGMGPHYEATYMLDHILWRLELTGAQSQGPGRARRFGLKSLRNLWKLVPEPLRNGLFPTARRNLMENLGSRLFYPVPNNDVFGAVRINVAGREPEGRVQPGEQFEQVCTDLQQRLLELENADTGQQLVQRVYRIRELYPEGDVDHLPDLLIEWNREAPISRVRSERAGLIEAHYRGCRTGDHRAPGLLVMHGPGVSPGSLSDISIMDVGPTVASLLDVALGEREGSSFVGALPSMAM